MPQSSHTPHQYFGFVFVGQYTHVLTVRIKLPGLWNSWVNHLCMSPRSVLQSILRVGGKQHQALRSEEISTPKPSRQITPHARCRKHVRKKKKGIMFIFWKEPSNALGVRNNTMLWICQSDTTIRFHPRRRANENILSYLLVPVHWSIIQIRGSQKTPLQICIRIKRPFLFVARIKRMGLWETLEEPIYVLYKWAHQVKLRARTRRRFLSLRRTKRRFWYVLTVIALLGKTVFQV